MNVAYYISESAQTLELLLSVFTRMCVNCELQDVLPELVRVPLEELSTNQ